MLKCISFKVAFFFLDLLQAKAFYSYWSEPVIIKNLKRGLASLFQFQLKTGKVIEVKINDAFLFALVMISCQEFETNVFYIQQMYTLN